MLEIFITFWGIANLFLVVWAFVKIRGKQAEVDFIWWWALLNGSFVWEDMFVFGLLHAGIAAASLLLHNTYIWIIGFLVFWIVRSAGETLYFFLQQFIVPTHHPHAISYQFGVLRKMFGSNISDQKCFIIMQITMQSILVTSLLLLIFVLRSLPY